MGDPAAGGVYTATPPLLPGGAHPALLAGSHNPGALGAPPYQQPDLAEAFEQVKIRPGSASGQGPGRDPWAERGYPIPGVGGWTQYREAGTGQAYYHHHMTNKTQWEVPSGWGV